MTEQASSRPRVHQALLQAGESMHATKNRRSFVMVQDYAVDADSGFMRRRAVSLPSGCTVLIAEDDPIMAVDVDDSLRRLGATVLGPVETAFAGVRALYRQRPNVALLSASIAQGAFLPLVHLLSAQSVPFGIMATAYESVLLRQDNDLLTAPRLSKPFDIASLHDLTRDLYRSELELRIEHAKLRIEAGKKRLAEQLRLIEKLAAAETPTELAEALMTNMARSLRVMRTSRDLMADQLCALD